MEKDVELIHKLAQAREMLSDDQNSVLDLDQLTQSLSLAEQALSGVAQKDAELEILRGDIIGKISGMAKAIAAVSRNHDETMKALEFVEELPQLRAENLVSAYSRLSARFRDAFPSTFGSTFRRS